MMDRKFSEEQQARQRTDDVRVDLLAQQEENDRLRAELNSSRQEIRRLQDLLQTEYYQKRKRQAGDVDQAAKDLLAGFGGGKVQVSVPSVKGESALTALRK